MKFSFFELKILSLNYEPILPVSPQCGRGCVPRGYPGSTLGVDPRSQGVIPKRFKQKKIFVTDGRRTNGRRTKDGRTDVKVEIVV